MGNRRAQDRHSELVHILEERVRRQYNITATEVEVRDPCTGEVIGEIDLVGIVDRDWDIYEVKVNDSPLKARRQLKNLKQYLQDCGNLTLYYYSGINDKLVKVD